MSEELATIQPSTAELMAAGGLGLEDTYIRPTYMKLVQRTTTSQEAVPGKIFDELTLTNFDTIQVVPLKIFRVRALFPETGKLGMKPLCRSFDGVAPSEDVEFPQSDVCARCPKASWADYDKKTGKGKPTCKENWQLLCILKETGLPRYFNIGGTSLTPFKKLLEQLKQDVVMAKAKGQVRNIFDYTFSIKGEFIQGEKGSYYVTKFYDVKVVQDSSEYGPLYMQYVDSARAKRDAAVAAAEVDAAVDDVVEGQTGSI